MDKQGRTPVHRIVTHLFTQLSAGEEGVEQRVGVDASDGDGKHPEEISLRPPKERDEIAEGEQACEEPRLDRASDESVDDRVGLPKARARAREDDRQRS